MIKMGKKAMQILSLKDEEFYEGMGMNFVELTTGVNFTNILRTAFLCDI